LHLITAELVLKFGVAISLWAPPRPPSTCRTGSYAYGMDEAACRVAAAQKADA
jgi:hypothetical protein